MDLHGAPHCTDWWPCLLNNFVRYSEQLVKELGCRPNGDKEDVAAVCRLDVKTHTILVKQKFCTLRLNSGRLDSIVSTLIHEATHYDESFGADDIFYGFDRSL